MFRQAYHDVQNPEYQRCCGIHVRKLASIVAIIYLILLTFCIPSALSAGKIFEFFFIGIGAVVYIFVLFADKQQKPKYYIPFLVYNGIYIILLPAQMVMLIVLMFMSPETLGPDFVEHKDAYVAILTVLVILTAIIEAIYVYCWIVVRDARRYMINEVISGNVVSPYVNQV